MGTPILIIGESGSGKSTAIRTLKPKETFIINVLDKPLPFRGWKKNYKTVIKGDGEITGNIYVSDKQENISKIIKYVDSQPHIKNLIIDDFQYIMANEFMHRATERGYDKFTDIAKHAWTVINDAAKTRSDLNVFFLSHSERDAEGRTKCKTIGKMLDDKITLEGMFTIVLNSLVVDEQHVFLTKNDGNNVAKSPMDLFQDKFIPNDLQLILNKLDEYFGDVPEPKKPTKEK
jgi:hypothetical protein